VARVPVPGDGVYAGRLVYVYRESTLPNNTTRNTVLVNASGELRYMARLNVSVSNSFASLGPVTVPNVPVPITWQEVLDDLQGPNRLLFQGEAQAYAFVTLRAEAQLATWLVQLAERDCRSGQEFNDYLDARLLYDGARENWKLNRFAQAAAVFAQLQRRLGKRPTSTNATTPCPC
jgi:hypothetical protein